jgi:hypothetical protein
MLEVMSQQPVGLAGDGREEHRDIGLVANQMTVGEHLLPAGVGNKLGMSQLDEAAIGINQMVDVNRWQALCVEEQILLHLVADDIGQDQLAHSCGAEGKDRFVEAPRRDDSAGQNVRIQEQAESEWGLVISRVADGESARRNEWSSRI